MSGILAGITRFPFNLVVNLSLLNQLCGQSVYLLFFIPAFCTAVTENLASTLSEMFKQRKHTGDRNAERINNREDGLLGIILLNMVNPLGPLQNTSMATNKI